MKEAERRRNLNLQYPNVLYIAIISELITPIWAH